MGQAETMEGTTANQRTIGETTAVANRDQAIAEFFGELKTLATVATEVLSEVLNENREAAQRDRDRASAGVQRARAAQQADRGY